MRRLIKTILSITFIASTVAVGVTDCMVASANASPVVQTVQTAP